MATRSPARTSHSGGVPDGADCIGHVPGKGCSCHADTDSLVELTVKRNDVRQKYSCRGVPSGLATQAGMKGSRPTTLAKKEGVAQTRHGASISTDGLQKLLHCITHRVRTRRPHPHKPMVDGTMDALSLCSRCVCS